MQRILFGGLAVATIVFGVVSVICPAWAVMHSRDEEYGPPTTGEIWFMRVVGVGAVIFGVAGLHAILTAVPGGAADGPPLP